MELGDRHMLLFTTKVLLLFALIGCLVCCSVNASTNSTACQRPTITGTCRQVLRYAYNPQTRHCVSFYYTGCNNARNSFLTFEECRRDCMENLKY